MTVRQAREHTIAQDKAKGDWRRVVRDDNWRLEEQFRKDLAEENSLTGHPKEPMLWSMVYNHSRSDGLSSMASYYEDLADLLK